jgi:N-acetylmuramoyl-L-alanine amidase
MTVNADEPIVIVIDPGHGGENLGGQYEDYTEKEMTMIVANAMKEELEQYEGITVYMTRTGDVDLTLEQRCEYAASVNADFIFCLHFNLSEHHTLFGAETWISAFGEQYSRGYEFATIEMELLQEKGLYSRGIKTRLNDEGIDYYGIIRHATERNIPCALIEHCHLDQENDQPFYDHKEKLEEFGRLDAEAVARYYGLKS